MTRRSVIQKSLRPNSSKQDNSLKYDEQHLKGNLKNAYTGDSHQLGGRGGSFADDENHMRYVQELGQLHIHSDTDRTHHKATQEHRTENHL
jgi:hypothetical protein